MQQLGTFEPIAALNRIRIIENNEPLVDIRRACPRVDVASHVIPYLRSSVAEMLHTASASIPAPFSLQVRSALRTMEMQKERYDQHYAELKKAHPEWPHSILRRETNQYLAPYDQPAPPGHSTGGAVDVYLIDQDGQHVDLVPPLLDWKLGHTHSTRVPEVNQQQRAMLYSIMTEVGFSNCRLEYWHYSFGDSAWAVRTGQLVCHYGVAPLPPGL